MYECEICGKHADALYVIDVEGAELSACRGCSEGKDVLEKIGEIEKVRGGRVTGRRKQEEAQEEVVENYGSKMRKARESMMMDLKTLGERINEKHSTLLRVEEEKMLPNTNLIAKLEKALGIKLTHRPEEPEEFQVKAGKEITLGDAAFVKDRKGN